MNNNRIFRFYVFLRTFLLFPRFRAFFWFAICSDQIGPERKCPVSEKAANLPDQMRYAGSGNFIYKCGKGHGPKQSMPGEGMDYLLRFMRLSAHLSLSAIVSIINQVWRNDNGPNIRIILESAIKQPSDKQVRISFIFVSCELHTIFWPST